MNRVLIDIQIIIIYSVDIQIDKSEEVNKQKDDWYK